MPLGSKMQSLEMLSIRLDIQQGPIYVISLTSSVQYILFANFHNWPWSGNILKGRRWTLRLEPASATRY